MVQYWISPKPQWILWYGVGWISLLYRKKKRKSKINSVLSSIFGKLFLSIFFVNWILVIFTFCHTSFEICFLDVGQGDACLVKTEKRKSDFN